MCVCVCVSAPGLLKTIHMKGSLNNQLSSPTAFRFSVRHLLSILLMGGALVT